MINLDQIFARTPFNSLLGTEILVMQRGGKTGGTLASTLKSFIKSNFVADDITDATDVGKQVVKATDANAIRNMLGIETRGPMTISASTTLGATHLNRRLFVDAVGITLTLNAADLTSSDVITVVNTTEGDITLSAGTGTINVEGIGPTGSTFDLPAYSTLKAYLINSDTWFFEV